MKYDYNPACVIEQNKDSSRYNATNLKEPQGASRSLEEPRRASRSLKEHKKPQPTSINVA